METFLLAIIAFVICFSVRVLPRQGISYAGNDAFYHMFCAETIREHGNRDRTVDYFEVGSRNDYPPVFHYLLALFPGKVVNRYNGFFAAFFDSLNALAVFLFAQLLTGHTAIAITAAILYSLTPCLQAEAFTLTPRLFGLLLFNLVFLSFLIYQLTGQMLFLGLATLFIVLDLFTHRIQYPLHLILSGALGIYFGTWLYPGTLVAAVILAGLLGRSFLVRSIVSYWVITRDNMKHHKEYLLRRREKRHYLGLLLPEASPQAKEEPPPIVGASLFRAFGLWEQRLLGASPITSLFSRAFGRLPGSLVSLLVASPWSLLALASVLFPGLAQPLGEETFGGLWLWSAIILVIFFLTYHIKQLGQTVSDGFMQYLTFGSLPASLLAAVLLNGFLGNGLVLMGLLALGLAGAVILMVSTDWGKTGSRLNDGLVAILKQLRQREPGKVMCLPPSYSYPVLYFSHKRIFDVVERGTAYREEIKEWYGTLKIPLVDFITKYQVRYILAEEAAAPFEYLAGCLKGNYSRISGGGYYLIELGET